MPIPTPYQPDHDRYDGRMPYRRVGRSGLQLPAVSLGLWQNFGDDVPFDRQEQILRRAFDLGITHFDLANNYGPAYGAAEENFGRHMKRSFAGLRHQLVISTKAGYDMWPGPYGQWGSRKYLLDSLDESLERMGLDHVDIFYSHRFDPNTPLEETMGALDYAVRSGRARYVGISSYSSPRTREAVAILRDLGTPCLIHQPSYSLVNRWIEEPYRDPDQPDAAPGERLVDVLTDEGVGCIAFSPLAQGLLSDKYLKGVPAGSRAATRDSWNGHMLTPANLDRIRGLNRIAAERGQTLAQMAVAWVLRDPVVTSALIGVSSLAQLDDVVGALARADFDAETLARIDEFAQESGINIWSSSYV